MLSQYPERGIMRAICIARHRFLSDHISSIFQDIGIDCTPVVGFPEGMAATRSQLPHVVICDYDVLVAAPLREWEADPLLAETPIIAVSLTRRPEEAHLVDTNGIAGFLYLPGLEQEAVSRVVRAATSRVVPPSAFSLHWHETVVPPARCD
jgi:hypothetical protein